MAQEQGRTLVKHLTEDPFVRFRREAAQDSSLSWKARGLLAYLLSLPNDWQIYQSHLQDQATDGRCSLSSGLDELEAAGYLKRQHLRNPDGTYGPYEYHVFDRPIGDDEMTRVMGSKARSENLHRECRNTDVENTDAENPRRITPDYIEDKKIEEKEHRRHKDSTQTHTQPQSDRGLRHDGAETGPDPSPESPAGSPPSPRNLAESSRAPQPPADFIEETKPEVFLDTLLRKKWPKPYSHQMNSLTDDPQKRKDIRVAIDVLGGVESAFEFLTWVIGRYHAGKIALPRNWQTIDVNLLLVRTFVSKSVFEMRSVVGEDVEYNPATQTSSIEGGVGWE